MGVSLKRYFRVARRGDDGAAAVEFALIFPIFMILALGIIAAGTAFSRQINVTQAAREASRYGATVDISTLAGTTQQAHTDAWLALVDSAAVAAVGGANNPIGGYDQMCVALVVTDSSGAAVAGSRHLDHGGSPVAGACTNTATAAIPSTTFVQVVLLRNVTFAVLFINPTIHVDAVSSTPYERVLS